MQPHPFAFSQNEMGAPPPHAPVDEKFRFYHRMNRKWFWGIIAAAVVITVLTACAVKMVSHQDNEPNAPAATVTGGFFMPCHSC